MDDNNQILEGKLVQSIEAKELGSLTADYTELGLDSILDEGIVKDIPILRTAVGLAKIGLNVRDRIYVKKIYGFLAEVGKTTQEEREEFVKKKCGNVKRFEETVLLILEQADRIEKTALIGKIFRACILGKINYRYALMLSEMVNKAFWMDLSDLFKKPALIPKWIEQRLFSAGLLRECEPLNFGETQPETQMVEYEETEYEKNEYADVLILIYNGKYDDL